MGDNILSDFFVNWWPWLNFWSDSFLIQLFIIYTICLLMCSSNVYYIIFYFFLVCFYFGLFLCIYQIELFTGFLWLIECVVVFAALLLLFFLKTVGTWLRLIFKNKTYKYLTFTFLLIIFIIQPIVINNVEHLTPLLLNNIDFWDNYYEAVSNSNVNDFVVFLISYYALNSIFLIALIFIILIASVICVNLNKINKDTKVQNFEIFIKLFDFLLTNVSVIFMRQQNIINQENQLSGTRIFKKKIIL